MVCNQQQQQHNTRPREFIKIKLFQPGPQQHSSSCRWQTLCWNCRRLSGSHSLWSLSSCCICWSSWSWWSWWKINFQFGKHRQLFRYLYNFPPAVTSQGIKFYLVSIPKIEFFLSTNWQFYVNSRQRPISAGELSIYQELTLIYNEYIKFFSRCWWWWRYLFYIICIIQISEAINL